MTTEFFRGLSSCASEMELDVEREDSGGKLMGSFFSLGIEVFLVFSFGSFVTEDFPEIDDL